MNRAPDRPILDKETIIRSNYSKEIPGWFIENLEIPEKLDYNIEEIVVLTTNSTERLEKFLEMNSGHHVRFTPFYGKESDTDTENVIFDNYLTILTNWFNKNEGDVIYIAEDDVLFLPGSFSYLIDTMKQLPKEWDTLSGNFSAIPKINRISDNLIRPVDYASSMNFTAFHRRSLDKIKSNLHLRNKEGKSLFNHIDRYCFSKEVNLNSYGTWPMLCREISGYSYNSKVIRSTFESLIESEPYRYWFLDKSKWTP